MTNMRAKTLFLNLVFRISLSFLALLNGSHADFRAAEQFPGREQGFRFILKFGWYYSRKQLHTLCSMDSRPRTRAVRVQRYSVFDQRAPGTPCAADGTPVLGVCRPVCCI
jgi:hypothetical protein